MSTKTKEIDLIAYFDLLNLEKEYYQLPLKKEWFEPMVRREEVKETLGKIMALPNLKEGQEADGKKYVYLAFEKKLGFTQGETTSPEAQNGSSDFMVEYFKLSRSLIEKGHKPETVDPLIMNPNGWDVLNTEEKEQAKKVFSLFSSSINNPDSLVTLMMRRYCKKWTHADTKNLAPGFYQEVLTFAKAESDGSWDEMGESSSSPEIIAIDN